MGQLRDAAIEARVFANQFVADDAETLRWTPEDGRFKVNTRCLVYKRGRTGDRETLSQDLSVDQEYGVLFLDTTQLPPKGSTAPYRDLQLQIIAFNNFFDELVIGICAAQ